MGSRESLTIYGDFNCPFSALASARVDRLLTAGTHDVQWRAVQHNPALPPAGQPLTAGALEDLRAEVRMVADLSAADVRLVLVVPETMSNTAAACAALAAQHDGAHWLRRRTFAAVWAKGLNISQATVVERVGAIGANPEIAARWQRSFGMIENAITPSMVFSNGVVSRGLGALARLAELVRDAQAVDSLRRRRF